MRLPAITGYYRAFLSVLSKESAKVKRAHTGAAFYFPFFADFGFLLAGRLRMN
jgi:hypothetical protein